MRTVGPSGSFGSHNARCQGWSNSSFPTKRYFGTSTAISLSTPSPVAPSVVRNRITCTALGRLRLLCRRTPVTFVSLACTRLLGSLSFDWTICLTRHLSPNLSEGGLQRVELVTLRQAFDRRDLSPLDEGSKRKARFHALAIHQDSAYAALPEATALLRPPSDAGVRGEHQAAWCADRAPAGERRVGGLRSRRRYAREFAEQMPEEIRAAIKKARGETAMRTTRGSGLPAAASSSVARYSLVARLILQSMAACRLRSGAT
jgi:hypothetical protein